MAAILLGLSWAPARQLGGAVAAAIFGTPHERYAARLTLKGGAHTADGRRWLSAATRALDEARGASLPARHELTFTADQPDAAAFTVRLRRGQRYVVDAEIRRGDPAAVFIDLFERTRGDGHRVASAAPGQPAVAFDIVADAEYLVRVQPALGHEAQVTLTLGAAPTLQLPVKGGQPSAVQSFFGDPRDGGRRAHQGVDIFAPRGTPVVAAAGGIVSSVGTNGLGGNVVWIARPARGERHYYAHLDRQLVTAGTVVRAGDVIGTVGNTGNARGTPPHLHFGIYAVRGAVDPLPYIAPPVLRIAPPRQVRTAASRAAAG